MKKREQFRSFEVRWLESRGKLDLAFLSAPRPEPARHMFLRKYASGSARDSGVAGNDRQAGSELLHPLPGAAEDGCGARSRQDRQGRLSLERRRGAAGNAGRLSRNRHPERPALCVAAAESRRVRTAEGLQREHRRIHQCRRYGARHGRPHRELERADGSDVRAAALAGSDSARSKRSFPPEFVEEFYRVRQNPRHQQPVQIPACRLPRARRAR